MNHSLPLNHIHSEALEDFSQNKPNLNGMFNPLMNFSMCKSEIFQQLLRLTAEETETNPDRITGRCTDMESTDARFILVTLLYERGFYPSQIAPLLNRTPRCVRALLSRGLTSPMVGIMLEKLRKRCGKDC